MSELPCEVMPQRIRVEWEPEYRDGGVESTPLDEEDGGPDRRRFIRIGGGEEEPDRFSKRLLEEILSQLLESHFTEGADSKVGAHGFEPVCARKVEGVPVRSRRDVGWGWDAISL